MIYKLIHCNSLCVGCELAVISAHPSNMCHPPENGTSTGHCRRDTIKKIHLLLTLRPGQSFYCTSQGHADSGRWRANKPRPILMFQKKIVMMEKPKVLLLLLRDELRSPIDRERASGVPSNQRNSKPAFKHNAGIAAVCTID